MYYNSHAFVWAYMIGTRSSNRRLVNLRKDIGDSNRELITSIAHTRVQYGILLHECTLRWSCFYPYVTHVMNFTKLPPFSACNIENLRELGKENNQLVHSLRVCMQCDSWLSVPSQQRICTFNSKNILIQQERTSFNWFYSSGGLKNISESRCMLSQMPCPAFQCPLRQMKTVLLVKISQKLLSEITDCLSSSINLSEGSSCELNITFLPNVVLPDIPAEPDDLSRSIYLVFFGGVLIFGCSTAKAKR